MGKLGFLLRFVGLCVARKVARKATGVAEVAAVAVAIHGLRRRLRPRTMQRRMKAGGSGRAEAQALDTASAEPSPAAAEQPEAAGEEPEHDEQQQAGGETLAVAEHLAHQLLPVALLLHGLRIGARMLTGRQARSSIPRLNQIGFQDEQVAPDNALIGIAATPAEGSHGGLPKNMGYPPVPRPLPHDDAALMNTSEFVQRYHEWMAVGEDILRRAGALPFPPGFDPDGMELARFLTGLRKARKVQQAAPALGRGLNKVREAVQWYTSFKPASPQQLAAWSDVVWWEGPDDQGFMWLHLHATRAVAKSNSHAAGEECALAVLTQLELCIRQGEPFTFTGGAPAAAGQGAEAGACSSSGFGAQAGGEQGQQQQQGQARLQGVQDSINVLVYCKGAHLKQAIKLGSLMRKVAGVVNNFFPNRLRMMYVADVPRGLWLLTEAIMALAPHDTKRKLKICRLDDVPFEAIPTATDTAQLQLVRSPMDGPLRPAAARVRMPAEWGPGAGGWSLWSWLPLYWAPAAQAAPSTAPRPAPWDAPGGAATAAAAPSSSAAGGGCSEASSVAASSVGSSLTGSSCGSEGGAGPAGQPPHRAQHSRGCSADVADGHPGCAASPSRPVLPARQGPAAPASQAAVGARALEGVRQLRMVLAMATVGVVLLVVNRLPAGLGLDQGSPALTGA